MCGVTFKMTPVVLNSIVCANSVDPPCCAPLAADDVGTGTSAPTSTCANELLLTSSDGAESVRTRDLFSVALRNATSSRDRPMKAKVVADKPPVLVKLP